MKSRRYISAADFVRRLPLLRRNQSKKLWARLFYWTAPSQASLAASLFHAVLQRENSPAMDFAARHPYTGEEIYIAVARGSEHGPLLKRAVALTMTGRGERTRQLHLGAGSTTDTPFSRCVPVKPVLRPSAHPNKD